MTFTLQFTNTLEDFTEANHHHQSILVRGVILLVFVVGVPTMLYSLVNPSTSAPVAPIPATGPGDGNSITILLQTLPWLLFSGLVLGFLYFSTKSERRQMAGLSAPTRGPYSGITGRIPNVALITIMVCAAIVQAGLYFRLPHPDGSFPGSLEIIIRILPLSVVGACFLVLSNRRALQKAWAKNLTIRLPQTLTLSDENVIVHNSELHSEHQWRAFQQIRETPNLFMLYLSGPSVLMIPKRALATAEIDAFRAFLNTHVLTSSIPPSISSPPAQPPSF